MKAATAVHAYQPKECLVASALITSALWTEVVAVVVANLSIVVSNTGTSCVLPR